ARVAHGDGGVAREEELRERFTHEARAAHPHRLRALDRDAVVIEDLDAAGRRARHGRWRAAQEIAQAHGMQPVCILLGSDGRHGLVLVHALGQRQLEQGAVQRGLGVDRANRLEQLGLRAPAREEEVPRRNADVVRGALLVADIDLGGRIVAHEDDSERGLDARPAPEGSDASLDLGQDLRRDLLAREYLHRAQSGRGTRSRSIERPRPVSGSMRMTAPCSAAGPLAGSNRFGICERKRWTARSLSTPITESVGPVIPRSVMYAVPLGSTRSSAVCTCRCVPTTALTRPSRYQPMACDSLVASQCMSTTTMGVSALRRATSSSAFLNGQSRLGRKTRPIRLSTATLCGPAFTTMEPAPGVPSG